MCLEGHLMLRTIIGALTVLALPAQTTAPAAQRPAQPSCPEMSAALQALMRNDVRLRDWAQLSRYRGDNTKVAPASAGESRVGFMGGAPPAGGERGGVFWGAPTPNNGQKPLAGSFFPGKPYLDRGISGQTTPQMLV